MIPAKMERSPEGAYEKRTLFADGTRYQRKEIKAGRCRARIRRSCAPRDINYGKREGMEEWDRIGRVSSISTQETLRDPRVS